MKLALDREELSCGDKKFRISAETTYSELKYLTTGTAAVLLGGAVTLKEKIFP